MYRDAGSDDSRCPCCNRLIESTGAQRVGRGCATVIALLLGLIVCTPLLWLARVSIGWALGFW